MVKEVKDNLNLIRDWNKKITLQLTLKDLQLIFDAVGNLNVNMLKEKYDEDLPFYISNDTALIQLIDKLYEDLQIIVDKYNGILDD